ncbi:type IVB secretion system protein IcmH/DotU [Bordetella genomosp. 9]|uniref:type IVB secretion system protein IcmH/DotU n=1 Tax=Bordetella genomosp. 9 TaxID=1416803 RepID=UPI0015C5FDBD|nr:type IVB secretion system protein IcmH/DotU [Bordetella genomosp. 9]
MSTDSAAVVDTTFAATPLFLPRHALNPLVEAAHPLLELGMLLRHGRQPPPLPLEELRRRLALMVRNFVDACAHVPTDTVAAARYCLCTYLDEAVAATPWGGEAWSARSLLVIFHGEASGGERFFTILHELSRDPSANIDVLELLSVILALGMQGRYRLSPQGVAALGQVRQKLRGLIRNVRGAPDSALSPRWRGDSAGNRRVGLLRPLWWVMAGLFFALVSFYGWLELRLRQQAETVALAREAVRVKVPVVVPPERDTAPPAPAAAPSLPPLASFADELDRILAADVDARRLRIDHQTGRVVLTLGSDALFASGSARVPAADLPLIRRIGDALRIVPGQVLVVGHTDDQRPAPGAPSNWALSLARATQVVELLRQETDQPQRFLAQGKGSSEPVASNDTPAGQARNRRVVITLLAPGASP